MIIAAWIVSALAALAFLGAGITKLSRPKAALAGQMAWVEDYTGPQVKLIAAAEVVGAIGLVLPVATGILPWLTPVAAFALAVIMIGAVVVHLRRAEMPTPALVLLALSLAAGILWSLAL